MRERQPDGHDLRMATAPIPPGPRDERGVLAARILRCARESFAENGWAGTTIRAVARAAGVDPGLVHHYYGSKDALLDACTTPPAAWGERIAAVWAAPRDELGVRMVKNVLANWRDPEFAPMMRAIMLTAAHEPRTAAKLRFIVENTLMGPSTVGQTAKERLGRASFIAAQLQGFMFMRYIWRIEPIASMRDDQIIAAMAPTIQRYIDADIFPARKARTTRLD